MDALFSKVLDMSLTASIVIEAVLAARYFLRKSPKVISYALWSVVLFRLLCPVSLTAPMSVLEVTQPTVTVTSDRTSAISYLPEIQPGFSDAEVPLPEVSPVAPVVQATKKTVELGTVAAWIWAAGVFAMAAHCLLSYLRLYRKLVGAVPVQGNVYLADHIATPFVLGILRPKIYIPSNTPEKERSYIIAHEAHHIFRFDHIIKLLAYGALCLHWFNPLVWLAFFLAGKDMEMSCDEAVIRKLGPEIRADYAQSLLRLATNRPIIAGIPLAFGEGDTKGRVKNMAKWKKPKAWVVITSIILCLAVLVSCAVNPGKENADVTPINTAMPEDGPVTMGMSIPGDVGYVEYGEREKRFFPREPIPGGTDYQFITTELLGGIRIYDTPEQPMVDMGEWLTALGVPQIISGDYDYMLTGGNEEDMSASFADAGGRETKHYYYTQGDTVFELWFDTTLLDAMTRAAMLESVYFAPDAKIEGTLPLLDASAIHASWEKVEEQSYMETCRRALEQLRGQGSYTVKSHTNNFGSVILNDTSSYWFYKDGEDWVKLSQIPDEGFDRGFWPTGYMCVDGKYYDNETTEWDNEENILWGESVYKPGAMPWIARFDWDAQDVLYVSKTPAGKGLCFTLQVMAPYRPENEDAYGFYQMQFIFDENVKLVRIENTFFSRNEDYGDYSSKETIQIMEDWSETVIDHEYQRYLNQK